MKTMSFAITKSQIINRTKTVTRRTGNFWINRLRPGDELLAVEKCQGLKRGEKLNPLSTLIIKKVSQERLSTITDEEVTREGFPEMNRESFIEMFKKIYPGMHGNTLITRIEFDYRLNQ